MNKWATVAGIVLIACFCALSFIELSSTAIPRLKTAAQVKASGGREVRFEGRVVPGSARYDDNASLLTVELSDAKNQRILVRYHGVKPAGFDDAATVSVTGRCYSGTFSARRIDLLAGLPR